MEEWSTNTEGELELLPQHRGLATLRDLRFRTQKFATHILHVTTRLKDGTMDVEI